MKRIMIIIGTRPEAIKMIPVIKELKKRKIFKIIICVTGQHKEMLYQILNSFDIIPDIDLSIMVKNQTLFDITSSILLKLNTVLEKEKPDFILVHGDTTTAFAGALSGFYKQIPVGHVEAGLRSKDIYSPYPEEFNRKAISLIAKLHFAPTELSKNNLITEGVPTSKIYVTGNTSIDMLKYTISDNYKSDLIEWIGNSKLVLVTLHRREIWGSKFDEILNSIKEITNEFKTIKVIFSTHLNPVIQDKVKKILGGSERIRITTPLNVEDFHNIIKASYIVLTDSGGLQEEASFLHVPLLVLRDLTERPEGVLSGTTNIVGTDPKSIINSFKYIFENEIIYNKMKSSTNPYGDGIASIRIADILGNVLD